MELIGLAVGGTIMIGLAASRRCRVWVSILIGTALIGTLAGIAPPRLLTITIGAVMSRDAIELMLMAASALYLGKLLTEFEVLSDLRHTLDKTIGNPAVPIGIIPAMIGCLPVAGGAIMSAPIVKTLTAEQGIPPSRGAAINQVFRHGVHMFLPFSPSLALGARLINLPLFTFVALLAPLGVLIYVLGYLIFLRGCSRTQPYEFTRAGLSHLLGLTAPIWLALVTAVVYRGPVFVPLMVGIVTALVQHARGRLPLLRWFAHALDPEIILTLPAAIGLRQVLVAGGVVGAATDALASSGIPLVLVCIILSAFVAGTSGNLMTHIAITFPILVSMAPPPVRPAYAVLCYSVGLFAYVVSPLHLCQIASLRCFGITPRELYREYAVILPMMFAGIGLLFMILLWLQPPVFVQ